MTTFPIRNNRQRAVIAVSVVLAVLTVTAVALRIISHRLVRRRLNASDYCAAAAAALAVALGAVHTVLVLRCGLAYDHRARIEAEFGAAPITLLLKLIIPLEFLWALALSACKVSVLLLYAKLFPGCRAVVRAAAAVIVAWSAGTLLAGLLVCRPLSQSWDPVAGGRCGNQVAFYLAVGSINIATDVTVLVLPMPYLYRLKLPKHTRNGLIVVFSLGFVTCITSIFRLMALSKIDFSDMTMTMPLATIFSGVEPSMAIVLCCVPLLRPLLGLNRRRRRRAENSRVIIAGNGNNNNGNDNDNTTTPTTAMHQYDPYYAGKLKLRPDQVAHRAEVLAETAAGTIAPVAANNNHDDDDEGEEDTAGMSMDSSEDLKGGGGGGGGAAAAAVGPADIVVNRQWQVTTEVGEWTQILRGR